MENESVLQIDGKVMELYPHHSTFETRVVYDIPVGESTRELTVYVTGRRGHRYNKENPGKVIEMTPEKVTEMTYELKGGYDGGVPKCEVLHQRYHKSKLFLHTGDPSKARKHIGTIRMDREPESAGDVYFTPSEELHYGIMCTQEIENIRENILNAKPPSEWDVEDISNKMGLNDQKFIEAPYVLLTEKERTTKISTTYRFFDRAGDDRGEIKYDQIQKEPPTR